jgi:hypothetical protein
VHRQQVEALGHALHCSRATTALRAVAKLKPVAGTVAGPVTLWERSIGGGDSHNADAQDNRDDRHDDTHGEALAQPEVLHQAHERDNEQLGYLRQHRAENR